MRSYSYTPSQPKWFVYTEIIVLIICFLFAVGAIVQHCDHERVAGCQGGTTLFEPSTFESRWCIKELRGGEFDHWSSVACYEDEAVARLACSTGDYP